LDGGSPWPVRPFHDSRRITGNGRIVGNVFGDYRTYADKRIIAN